MIAAPIRILHVFRTYAPDSKGGAEETIRQVCRSTSILGFENRVFAPSRNPNPRCIESDGGITVRVKLSFEIQSCGFCLAGVPEFCRQAEWADIIHYHFPWPFQDVLHFVARVDKPSIVTYHSDITRQQRLLRVYRPLMNYFLDSVDRIVCTSTQYVDTSENLRRLRYKVSVVPIGLAPESYPVSDSLRLDQVKQAYGEGFFLFIGMLRYYKGLHILVEACRNRQFSVVIAGKGPLEKELKQHAKRLSLDNVVFAGEVSDEDKVCLLQLCSGVVLPSHLRAEAFGVSLLEGAMYGKPLITTKSDTGVSYVNIDGETGLVVPVEDPVALGNAMERLSKDDALANRLGNGARERFERLFTADVMGQRYAEHYRELLKMDR